MSFNGWVFSNLWCNAWSLKVSVCDWNDSLINVSWSATDLSKKTNLLSLVLSLPLHLFRPHVWFSWSLRVVNGSLSFVINLSYANSFFDFCLYEKLKHASSILESLLPFNRRKWCYSTRILFHSWIIVLSYVSWIYCLNQHKLTHDLMISYVTLSS